MLSVFLFYKFIWTLWFIRNNWGEDFYRTFSDGVVFLFGGV